MSCLLRWLPSRNGGQPHEFARRILVLCWRKRVHSLGSGTGCDSCLEIPAVILPARRGACHSTCFEASPRCRAACRCPRTGTAYFSVAPCRHWLSVPPLQVRPLLPVPSLCSRPLPPATREKSSLTPTRRGGVTAASRHEVAALLWGRRDRPHFPRRGLWRLNAVPFNASSSWSAQQMPAGRT